MKEKGATNYGIAAVAAKIIKAIINDENVVMPISAMLHGEYGIRDIYAGVPAVLTGKGVKELVELHLTNEELQQFQISAKVLLEVKKKCDEMILS